MKEFLDNLVDKEDIEIQHLDKIKIHTAQNINQGLTRMKKWTDHEISTKKLQLLSEKILNFSEDYDSAIEIWSKIESFFSTNTTLIKFFELKGFKQLILDYSKPQSLVSYTINLKEELNQFYETLISLDKFDKIKSELFDEML